MNVIKKQINLTGEDYYIKHLSIINSMLPVQMTTKELEVLGTFMSLEGDIADRDRFGTTCRKIVKEKLNLSDGGLSNHLKSLKEKSFIYSIGDNKMAILDVLLADESQQGYMFKITKYEAD